MNDCTQPELLFLIARFLEHAHCDNAAKVLKEELDKLKLLPRRRTWEGEVLPTTFKDTISLYKGVPANSLSKLVDLALKQYNATNRSFFDSPLGLIISVKGASPHVLRKSTSGKSCNSLAYISETRLFGSLKPHLAWDASRYKTCVSTVKVFGHLAPIFCVAFDRRSEIVFTGSDDKIIKAWQLSTGRLLATFRGHHAEISDLAISPDNRLMASGSCDKTLRIWDLRSTANFAVLKGHNGTVTAVAFSPMFLFEGDDKTPPHQYCYLASGGADGVLCLWRWNGLDNTFNEKPIKFIEKSRAGVRILSMSFSEGGYLLVTGSSDCAVRVYQLAATFEKIAELEGHTDEVDSLQFANNGLRFATASCDGTVRIFHRERHHWKQLTINSSQTLNNETFSRVQVCMIRWTCDDEFIVASVSDKSVKVFDAQTGDLYRVLKGHKNQAFCISCSNFDPNLVVSGGYDGLIIVWNIQTGQQVFYYQNKAGANFEENGAIHALSLSPDDSLSLVAADSYGHLIYFSFGQFRPNYPQLPEQLFFNTDYRAITHSEADMPLDEPTQRPPHELPPAWLIDSEGAPYQAELQQLVPGRERLSGPDNIPEVIVDDEGYHEVTDRSMADAAAGRPPQNRPAAWIGSSHLVRGLDPEEIQNMIEKHSALYDAESQEFEEETTKFLFNSRYTTSVVNRLYARALFDTDSDREELPSRAGAGSADSSNAAERSRRAAARRNHIDNTPPERSGETRSRARHRVIVQDEDNENANHEAPSTSGGRTLRSTRRSRRVEEENSRSRGIVENGEESRSRDIPRYGIESEGSSDMSVSEAVERIAPTRTAVAGVSGGPGSNNNSRSVSSRREISQQAQQQRNALANGFPEEVESDEEEEEEEDEASSSTSAVSFSDVEGQTNSDDSDWRPAISANGHRELRSTRNSSSHVSEAASVQVSRRSSHTDQPSTSRRSSSKSRKRKKRKSARKLSESPSNSRYELRDHSKPSTSRFPTELSSASSNIPSTSSMAPVNRRVRNVDQPVVPDDKPTERSKRYSQRLTSKRSSPRLLHEQEASGSNQETEIFDVHKKKNGISKSNGIVNGDCERFQILPAWMTQSSSTVRFPFVPQIGDEVVYIWRGHRLYVDSVQAQHAYTIKKGDLSQMPYTRHQNELLEEEFCRVENMEIETVFETGARLISVDLVVLRTTFEEFPIILSFKFHDLANVLDFVILKQWYDRSLLREWTIGNRFRSLIDGQWYSGHITGRQPAAPRCNFRIYLVMWDEDDGEDAVSPWDIEPLPKVSRNFVDDGASSSNDIAAYKAAEHEWPPSGNRETTSHRILECLNQVMSLAAAEPFVVPVDYTVYPDYLRMVSYPVDLSLVRQRIENGYYRRLDAIKWDLKYISINAAIFNEDGSEIVRQAQTIVDIMTSVINDDDCVDASAKLSQRISSRKRVRVTYNEDYGSSDGLESDEDGPSTSQPPAKRAHRSATSLASSSSSAPHWKTLCQEILSRLWKCPASAPFLKPVDIGAYPDYIKIVRTPIDLGTIKRRLQKGEYSQSQAFVNDVRLLFQNSRRYNRNQDSAIYSMTTRLLDIFESSLQEFNEILEASEAESVDNDLGKYASTSSASSRRIATATTSRSRSRRREMDDAGRYRTRLTTGSIHYSNVQEVDDALDMAIDEDANSQRRSYFRRQEEQSRYQYRRLRTTSGASPGTGGSYSLRRPSTRHMS